MKTIGRWIKKCLKWYRGLFWKSRWYTKLLGIIGTFALLSILWFGMVHVNFLWLFGKSPSIDDIMNPETSQASEIYSADGVMIGKYFNENRTPVNYEDVNPVFWDALIDTEDERFYQHFGIDFQGLFAAAKDMIVNNDARGASTITQQLVKNMFRVRTKYSTGLLGKIPGLSIFIMKSKEWISAVQIEYLYDKKDILTMYANTVDFGSNAFGIKTACKTYFNTTPKELTAEQAATLVGMLKATTYYNPISHPENSIKRRNIVLQNMRDHDHLTTAQFDSIKQIPIELQYSVEKNYDGQAQYFREAVADYLKDWCKENGYDLYNSGLKIYTTLDTRMQKYAEQAVQKQMQVVQRNFNQHWGKTNPWQDEYHHEMPNFIEGLAKKTPKYKYLVRKFPNNYDSVRYYLNLPHPVKVFDYAEGQKEMNLSTMDSIRYMERFMHCGFVAMEPNTGHVKAWVGDVDFTTWKYDKVTAMRQPGSTFKLFVYTEAMNQGITPCDKRRDSYFSMRVFDKQKQMEVTWAPTNANGRFSGDSLTLKAAYAQSINSIAVKLGQEVGIDNVVNTAHAMGIQSPLDNTPSLALGASDVNLLELVNAYSTPINNGKYHEATLVTKILDRKGNVVFEAPTEQQQVIPYKSAYFVQELMKGGLTEPAATSQSLWGYVGNFRDTEFGGKTGTSNNHSDAWFVGVSPKLVCGAWVGGEYRCIHFRTGALGQGSRTALPVCGLFYQAVLSDPNFRHYHGKFAPPKDEDIKKNMYDCHGYSRTRHIPDSAEIDSSNVLHGDEVIIYDSHGRPVFDNRNTPPGASATPDIPMPEEPSELAPPANKPKEEEVYI